jgi:hypothetical protein
MGANIFAGNRQPELKPGALFFVPSATKILETRNKMPTGRSIRCKNNIHKSI